MTGQNDNGTVTQSPTDDELRQIEKAARASMPSGEFPTLADRRRALYDAGHLAGALYEAKRCGHTLVPDVDWLLTDEAIDFWNELTKDGYKPRNVLKELHDRITGGG